MVEARQSRVRYLIITILFIVSCFSFADRSALSQAASVMPKGMNLNAARMGYLLFAFGWAYALGQLPSGGLLDRFGSKRVYGIAIIGWSICAFLTAFAGYLAASAAFTAIFVVRIFSGLFQSPVFPGNGRIVAAWFPTSERGRTSAIFNSAQYFALPIFAPIFGWLIHIAGWRSCFWFIGVLGCVLTVVWYSNIYGVKEHPRISPAEVETIERGGGLVNTDSATSAKKNTLTWATVKKLLSYRMLVGVYIGQFCITTLTWFFLTWFPLYLAQARHMSVLKVGFAAAVPGLCGGIGGILGGVISDKLLQRGHSLSFARKVPIMAGMGLAICIIACNYSSSQSLMLFFMSLSFFGKGIGALGWTVVSDTSPKGMVGMNGALFNLFGNLAGITTPLIIGPIVVRTHSYNGALVFIACIAFCVILSYGLIVGEIKRLDFSSPQAA
ncbi:putative D-glucarate transporter [Candidatus Sulfotelmatomonas gaucii]|uniref:Putative D-glucarate transporter n=1 Tax=Candidatus Sulfuritelmatomonas gaucii TaxID=2043161 RepID=A0A2N9L2V0_9BACT|nr:putative D-glucarate transporter [Candidatus Sulfotelmatomonas gaucii]